jgi:AcrR family transcriptional regulator
MKESPPSTRLGSAERRERILEETLKIVSQRGYHGFGLQELADRCGLTKAGLLHHFGSKEQLLIALLRDRDARDEMALAGRYHQGTEPGTTPPLSAVIDLLRATALRNSGQAELVRLYAVLRTEALNAAHPAHGFFRAREAARLDLFTELVSPYVDDPRSMARQIIALMSGLEEQWLREGPDVDLVAEWDRAATKLFAGARKKARS